MVAADPSGRLNSTVRPHDGTSPLSCAAKVGLGPGVSCCTPWWGLIPCFKRLCDRFARAGFVALAPDLYAGRIATTATEAKALRSESTAKRKTPAYKLLIAAIEQLRTHEAVQGSRISQVGFSMGGHWALWLAQRPDLPIGATVVFYAARDGDYTNSESRFLFHFAQSDDWVSATSAKKLVKSLANANADATYYTYPNTTHWFFEDDRKDAYNKSAAAAAWKRTITFLNGV
ncbi:MAG: dienelactone hydrolase family protein [Gammaproteobacteria bacterium]|nr:dienelactone hydrolase family protein [Gammaproteobacteria bacterium]